MSWMLLLLLAPLSVPPESQQLPQRDEHVVSAEPGNPLDPSLAATPSLGSRLEMGARRAVPEVAWMLAGTAVTLLPALLSVVPALALGAVAGVGVAAAGALFLGYVNASGCSGDRASNEPQCQDPNRGRENRQLVETTFRDALPPAMVGMALLAAPLAVPAVLAIDGTGWFLGALVSTRVESPHRGPKVLRTALLAQAALVALVAGDAALCLGVAYAMATVAALASSGGSPMFVLAAPLDAAPMTGFFFIPLLAVTMPLALVAGMALRPVVYAVTPTVLLAGQPDSRE